MAAPEPGTLESPVRLVGTVTDMYGLAASVGVDHGCVTVRAHGATLNAAQRKDFMLAWMKAERQAGAHERGVIAAASIYPPGCELPGCVCHYRAAPDGCLCPAWFDGGGHHLVQVNPACGAHQAREAASDGV